MSSEIEHLSLTKIRRYSRGELPDFDREAVEDHFAECDDCFAIYCRMDALFGEGFTAAAHEAAIESARHASDSLVVALRAAAARFGNFAGSLKNWLDTAPSFWSAGDVPAFGAAAAAVKGKLGPLIVNLASGVTRARVQVAESGEDVHVLVEGCIPRLAVLFDPESDFLRASAFEQTAAGAIARFENLPEGEYLVAVSPSEIS